MSDAPYIPKKTREELASAHPEGSRHAAMIKIAMSLLGNGISQGAVFMELRSKFPPEKTDKEIQDVIQWCQSRNPEPSQPTNGAPRQPYRQAAPAPLAALREQRQPVPALELATDFIGDDKFDVEKTVERSPIAIGEPPAHAETLFANLYEPADQLNIVCAFTTNDKGKANPKGGGKSQTRDEWIEYFKTRGTPESNAGAWTRPNPCRDGSGAGGAITDSDILRYDFLLIESDTLPLDVQLSLYAKFNLPIAAILTSGGGSAHAWVRLRAPDETTYRAWAKRILETLAPFGFDQSNKNPSRLSRLPGAVRKIGAHGDGVQRLLYVDPTTAPCSDEMLAAFEKQVTPPFFTKTPMRSAVRRSIDRYEELMNNRDEIGLRTGISRFDHDTGGLKRGNFIVLAAETNVGKSSVGLNIINRALNDNKAVALFSLEMDQDEILDLLVSMNFGVDRNVFNTGRFSERDLQRIAAGTSKLSQFPLYVYDNPGLTIEDIERHAMALAQQVDLRLIVVDYLQLVLPPANLRDSREQQIAFIGRSLRILAKKCKVPLIAVSQLNEEGKIRESRAVAHDAHIVFMLEADGDMMTMRVTKGRSIQKKAYTIQFDPLHCKVNDVSPIDDSTYEARYQD